MSIGIDCRGPVLKRLESRQETVQWIALQIAKTTIKFGQYSRPTCQITISEVWYTSLFNTCGCWQHVEKIHR